MAAELVVTATSKAIPGVHVQWPWSQLIVDGKKTIETRGYRIPEHLLGVELAIIETAGRHGKKMAGITTARIIGTMVVNSCRRYLSKAEWERDLAKHCVLPTEPSFAFGIRKETWAWEITAVTKLPEPAKPPKKRGIKFARDCMVPFSTLRVYRSD